MAITLKAEFTLLLDHDGYWLVEKAIAPEVIAAPEKFRHGLVKTHSKIASCRLALEKAVAMGANELHIYGLGRPPQPKRFVLVGSNRSFIIGMRRQT